MLTLLVFLAISSGVPKVMLMRQDVEYFGQYGFTHPILMTFGVVQIIGGVLLAIPKTRVVGAIIVGISFLISAVVLIVAGNIPLATVTGVALVLLAFVATNSLGANAGDIET